MQGIITGRATQQMGGFSLFGAIMLAAFVWLGACQQPAADQQKEKEEKASPFYPFPQYLQDELNYIDTMPLAITYRRTKDGILADSFFLDKPRFRQLIEPLIGDDPNKKEFQNQYRESSFQDLTLNTLTFSITATDAALRLQQADILLQPDTKKVKKLILKRQWAAADSTVNQTILWTHAMRCQISEAVSFSNGKAYTQVKDFIWDQPL
jgi:hypothetical protein